MKNKIANSVDPDEAVRHAQACLLNGWNLADETWIRAVEFSIYILMCSVIKSGQKYKDILIA